MASVLQRLCELHGIDRELAEVAENARALPAAVAEAEGRLAETESRRKELLERARAAHVEADKSSLEIKAVEEKIAKYQSQLNIVKTQKEYDAVRSEISACQAQISEMENAGLTAYEQADHLKAGAGGLEPDIADVRRDLEARRARLAGQLAELEKRRAALLASREELCRQVEPEELQRYERVQARYPGQAMTRVDGGVCVSCNMKLSPQVYNLVLLGEAVQQCRSCGRLCYGGARSNHEGPGVSENGESGENGNNAEALAQNFVDILNEYAAQYGLEVVRAVFKEMGLPGMQARRTLAVKRQGETMDIRWLLYYKVSRSSPGFWGLTPGILAITGDAAGRLQASWGVVLLAASPRSGFLLEAADITKESPRWATATTDDNYKINENVLPSHLGFGDIESLWSRLGLEASSGEQPADA